MEYHGSRLSARARRPSAGARRPSANAQRPEPSWPAVIATTVRLWVERHPFFGREAGRRRRVTLALVAVAVAVAVVALGAGVAGAVLGQSATSSPASQARGSQPGQGAAAALGASAAARGDTASWIAAQVAPSAVVACDPAMCAALQADGLQATRLLVLGTTSADPLGSSLVVATAAVRNQFGARLASVYAPALVASFGSGANRIDVRAIAPDGAGAYLSSLAADRRSRISAGSQLVRNPRITVSASARAALSAGNVDPRLLTLLAALAPVQPVLVSSFGDPAPGPGATVPLRSAMIALGASGAKASAAPAVSRLRSMLAFIKAQQQPYLPLRASLDGTSALTVEYAAPSPLGLLSGP